MKTPIDAGTLYYPEAGVNADIAQQISPTSRPLVST